MILLYVDFNGFIKKNKKTDLDGSNNAFYSRIKSGHGRLLFLNKRLSKERSHHPLSIRQKSYDIPYKILSNRRPN